MNNNINKIATSALLVALLSACGSDDDNNPESVTDNDKKLREILSQQQLSGDASAGRQLPAIEEPLAQLGMKLFFSKALGGDQDSACVSCHHPMMGGGDNVSLPVGVDAELPDLLGPGRFHSSAAEHFDGGPTVPRNAPTTFNIGLWDQVLFHDGRVESLGKSAGKNGDDGSGIRTPDSAFGQADVNAGANLTIAQARFPVTSAEEMKNFSAFAGLNNTEIRQHLQQRLGGYGTPAGGPLASNQWLDEFRQGFGEAGGSAESLITFDNIAAAIGAYENSQVFVDSPWKAFVQGDEQAISAAAKRGALLFHAAVADGGAGCAACHSGDFYTDEQFHVIAMPQIGRGKGDGADGSDDFGRYRETAEADDRYAFRTPTLLNVAVTGPWGHAGGYTRLEDVIRHHANPQHAIDQYDFTQLQPNIQASRMKANTQKALDQLATLRQAEKSALPDIHLTDQQVTELVAFLQALTDPCVQDRQCMSRWIPDASDENPDGLRLNAYDHYGRYF